MIFMIVGSVVLFTASGFLEGELAEQAQRGAILIAILAVALK
jgi:hypothetical protein